jgi:predicted nucleotidyltransferase
MMIETEIYRAIARAVALNLGRDESVASVYARRSVAAGSVVLGRSDIDLHVIIRPPASLEAEAELLVGLSERLARMKRIFPMIGHFDVSTRAELERWYREQPFHRVRDHGWLHLYGEELERPSGASSGLARNRALWWYFWAAQQLPRTFRTGNARSSFNLILDMFDAYRFYTGTLQAPSPTRVELVQAWYESGPASPARAGIVQASRWGFRAHRGAALAAIYRESLALHDLLLPHVSERVAGSASGRLRSRVPPGYDERALLIVESQSTADVDSALESMRRDATVWVLTEGALQVYLFHRNPWERGTLTPANGNVDFGAVPHGAFEQSLRFSFHREIPRHYGFRREHALIGPLYAQARLYAEARLVTRDLHELREAYRERYGAELATTGSQKEYFRVHYPLVCNVIGELQARGVDP